MHRWIACVAGFATLLGSSATTHANDLDELNERYDELLSKKWELESEKAGLEREQAALASFERDLDAWDEEWSHLRSLLEDHLVPLLEASEDMFDVAMDEHAKWMDAAEEHFSSVGATTGPASYTRAALEVVVADMARLEATIPDDAEVMNIESSASFASDFAQEKLSLALQGLSNLATDAPTCEYVPHTLNPLTADVLKGIFAGLRNAWSSVEHVSDGVYDLRAHRLTIRRLIPALWQRALTARVAASNSAQATQNLREIRASVASLALLDKAEAYLDGAVGSARESLLTRNSPVLARRGVRIALQACDTIESYVANNDFPSSSREALASLLELNREALAGLAAVIHRELADQDGNLLRRKIAVWKTMNTSQDGLCTELGQKVVAEQDYTRSEELFEAFWRRCSQ